MNNGVQISVKLEGDRRFTEALSRLRLLDLHDTLDQIGSRLVLGTERRFEGEVGPDGKSWKKSRRAEEGGRTLTDTARLVQSITHKVAGKSVMVGTNLIYAAIHQFGGTIRPRRGKYLRFRSGGRYAQKQSVTLPARPFLGINASDEKAIAKIIDRAIAGRVAR
jgi:phage virion morphogenesis protein